MLTDALILNGQPFGNLKIVFELIIMHCLIQQATLIDSLYKGSWISGKRDGFGIQLFPNGARFIGNWKDDVAHGFGRLELSDGTYYEGNYLKNSIQWGKLVYYNGSYFEGDFDGFKDLFKDGKFVFRDSEVFHGVWSPDGVILSGHLMRCDGSHIKLQGEDLVREPYLNYSGKIVYWKKGLIYEGGLRNGNYHKQGFTYGNYLHPFYSESNYKRQKFHGRYKYNSVFYGFSTEEFYNEGKAIGNWTYQTSKGYEYVADTSTKKHFVRFPFLNKDYYEGEINMWCHNIVLVSGTYHLFQEELKTYKLIRVINCNSITTQKDIRKRYNCFADVNVLIERTREESKRVFLSSESLGHFLDDGSTFKGQVLNNYIQCHRNDFVKLMNLKQQRSPPILSIESCGRLFFRKRLRKSSADEQPLESLRFFKGVLIKGSKNGFCHFVDNAGSEFKGFYLDDKKVGFGFYKVENKFKYAGNFSDGSINGQGTMITQGQQLIKGEFANGFLKGLGYIRYLNNNMEFFGEMLQSLRHGKGVLKFNNDYKFEGKFCEDKIDDSEKSCRLICKKTDSLEEGTYLPSKDLPTLGFFAGLSGNYYILDFDKGFVKKTL